MRRTLEVLEGVRDGCGRLRRLLLVGRPELLVSSFGVQDALDGGGPQPLRAVEVAVSYTHLTLPTICSV